MIFETLRIKTSKATNNKIFITFFIVCFLASSKSSIVSLFCSSIYEDLLLLVFMVPLTNMYSLSSSFYTGRFLTSKLGKYWLDFLLDALGVSSRSYYWEVFWTKVAVLFIPLKYSSCFDDSNV